MGTRWRRPAAGRGGQRGRAALPTLVALLVFGASPVAAVPRAGTPTSGVVRAHGAQTTTIHLLRQEPWLQEGGTLHIGVRIDGAPPDAVVEIERHPAIDTRAAFNETIEDEELGSPGRTVKTPLLALAPSADGVVELPYPTADDPDLDSYGVYPVRVIVADASGSTLAELVTFLVLLPDPGLRFPALNVAVVMEIGGPLGLQPDGSVALSSEALAAVGARIDVLQAAQPPITVAPSPETLDALDEVGDHGRTLLNLLRVELTERRPLARPYVDLDLGALMNADLLTQVPPEAEAGAQVIRTRFEVEPSGGTWLSGPTLGTDGVDALRELGAPYAVVPESAIESVGDEDAGTVPTQPIALGEEGPLAFVADEALGERLTGMEGALDAQRFLAELAVIWMSRPSTERGVVVRVPEAAVIDPDMVANALNGMATGDAIDVVSTSDLFQELQPEDEEEEEAPVADLATHAAPHDLRPLVDPLGEAQAKLLALAATLGDGQLIGSLQRSLLVSLDADTPNDVRADYIRRVDQAVADVATKVSAPADFQITLTARDGTIPLSLTNETGRNIVVKVHLESSQLSFPQGTTRTVTLPPGNTWVDVDVRTRTSGAFPLDISITSADDTLVLDQTTFTIRSTAVSGAGAILSAGAGLFLLVWWARHWRTAKRSRRLVGREGTA